VLLLGKRLKNSIHEKNYEICELIFNNFEELKKKIEKHPSFFEEEIYILLVESKKRLMELTDLESRINGKQIVLIIPDESEYMMRAAVKLYPRFITRIGGNFDDLFRVLKKMSGNK
jgi:hypothetical protein